MEFKNELMRLGHVKRLPAEEVRYDMAGTSRALAGLSAEDVTKFADQMDLSIRHFHPDVKALIVRNAEAALDMMRIVAYETKSGYGGVLGSGSQLDFTISWAYDYIDPDIVSAVPTVPATDNRKTWRRFIGAVSAPGTPTPFITGAVAAVGTPVDLTLAEEDGLLFLGFVNRADIEPKGTGVEFVYNSDIYDYQTFNHDLAERKESMNQSMVIYELKQAYLMVPPEQSIQVNIRYDDIGVDYLQPIVIRYRRASDMRNL